MALLTHILLIVLSASVIWFLSGMLVDATNRVAKRFNKPGFAVAFLVLGLLTSIGELSVAVNATIEGVPQVSAGNLLGASTVVLLLLIPLLAIVGDGIPLSRALRPSSLLLLLGIVLLPSLLSLDGKVTPTEGAVMLLLYAALIYRIQKRRPAEQTAAQVLRDTEKELIHARHATLSDIFKITCGAILIFVAGSILVKESIFFASRLQIPVSFVGLLALSIGTNIPEIVIAIRCVLGRHKDIALGDYMGSIAANTLIFGALAIVNGTFNIAMSEAVLTCAILGTGGALFFLFGRTKGMLSRKEGYILLALYMLFLVSQIMNAVRLSDTTDPPDVLRYAAPNQSTEAVTP